MGVLADDVAAHDWSVAGAGICGKPGKSMATLTSQRQICTSAGVDDRGPVRRMRILNRGRWEGEDAVAMRTAIVGPVVRSSRAESRCRVACVFIPPAHAG